MKQFLISYFSILLPLIALDAIWLSLMTQRLYQQHIGHLLSEEFHYLPALFFYLLFSFGITVFVVMPSVANGYTIGMTFLLGAILGAVAYGTYDLTNHATLPEWPLLITVIDIVWGAFLTGGGSTLAVLLTRWLL